MANWFKISLILAFTLLVNFAALAQVDEVIDSTLEEDEVRPVKALPDDIYKFGIKLGCQFSTVTGTENAENTFRFGINGGVYMRKKFKSQKWGYQVELNGSIRGSSFNAVKDDDYSALRLVYLDVPTYLFVNLTKDENQKILFGPQFSYLLSSTLYKGSSGMAYDKTPRVNDLDVLACLGYHHRLGHISIQTVCKYGFLNANNGLIDEALPKNKGGSMNNLVFELNLVF